MSSRINSMCTAISMLRGALDRCWCHFNGVFSLSMLLLAHVYIHVCVQMFVFNCLRRSILQTLIDCTQCLRWSYVAYNYYVVRTVHLYACIHVCVRYYQKRGIRVPAIWISQNGGNIKGSKILAIFNDWSSRFLCSTFYYIVHIHHEYARMH